MIEKYEDISIYISSRKIVLYAETQDKFKILFETKQTDDEQIKIIEDVRKDILNNVNNIKEKIFKTI